MSTFLGEKPTHALESEKELAHYFQGYAKSRQAFRVGIEVEILAVNRSTGKALSYAGEPGIQAILEWMARERRYEPIREAGNITALRRGGQMITLEPGGQIELSAPPTESVFEIQEQVTAFFEELRGVRQALPGIEFLAAGIQPYSTNTEISWVPKERYAIMADYLKARGTRSHDMMKRTATNQVNLDYTSEAHAMSSLRVVLGITSIVSAMFANSAFSEGKWNGFVSERVDIWNHTDPARTGMLWDFFREGCSFQDYVDYLLEMPMMFLVRDGKWIAVPGITFRRFIRDGFAGHRATLADFELHLSTAFPEARFKQYLEIRGADGLPPALIPSLAAFWKGILYDEPTREQAWELIAYASLEEHQQLRADVARQGLQARLGNRPVFELAQELVRLACISLGRQKKDPSQGDECIYLDRIRERILGPGLSPAESFRRQWKDYPAVSPASLIESLSIG